jgi:hypothetical protein
MVQETTELLQLIKDYGWPTTIIAIGVFLLVRGEFTFRYPRK